MKFDSNRYVDATREKNMMEALDTIYSEEGLSTERTNDRERQLKGIDFLLEVNSESTFKVDEKAATTKEDAFSKLPTYSFELASANNPDGKGWVFQEGLETTHYALVYPQSDDDFKTLSAVEIFIIPKQSILDFLWEKGISSKRDAEDTLEYQGRYDSIGRLRCRIDDSLSLVQSFQLAEEPICAIIDRGILRRMAWKVIKRQPKSLSKVS